MTPSFPTLNFSSPLTKPLSTNPYYSSYPTMPGFSYPVKEGASPLDKIESSSGFGSQQATNVIDVRNPLFQTLMQYQQQAGQLAGQNPRLGRLSLSQNFAGPDAYQNMLKGGIDFFGQQGISEGIQNINLQRDSANAELARSLGATPGQEGLLSVLKNMNLNKSLLAANPLISQAQKDTSGRVESMINLQNQLTQLANQTKMQQLGFNQQAQLAELQARLGLLQPQQNLLDILSSLQGQQRGVTTTEQQQLGRNFK